MSLYIHHAACFMQLIAYLKIPAETKKLFHGHGMNNVSATCKYEHTGHQMVHIRSNAWCIPVVLSYM